MQHFLALRPHWWIIGPAVGLITLAVAVTVNERIGVLGGYSDVVVRLERRGARLGWKAFFLLGIVGGALLFGILSARWGSTGGYGWLGEHWYTGPALLGAGVLIGFGAKTAGGCTSGNGLGGCSACSPAGFVSTATFMGTAIVLTFLFRWIV